jgi:hypothetical protein
LDEICQQSAFGDKLTRKTVERNTRGKQLGRNLNKEGTEAQYKETIASSISVPKPPKTPLKKTVRAHSLLIDSPRRPK